MTEYRKNIAVMKNEIDKMKLEKQDLIRKYEREIADLKMKNGEKDLKLNREVLNRGNQRFPRFLRFLWFLWFSTSQLNIAENLYPDLTNIFSRAATNQVEMIILVSNAPPCNSNQLENNINSFTNPQILEAVTVEPEISTEDSPTNIDIEDTNDVSNDETMDENPENEVGITDVNNDESSEDEEHIGDDCASTNDGEEPGPEKSQKETELVCKWVTPRADGTPQLCGSSFKTSVNMLTHMRMYHLRMLTTNMCRWQGCKRSGLRFEQKSILDQHVSVHVGELRAEGITAAEASASRVGRIMSPINENSLPADTQITPSQNTDDAKGRRPFHSSPYNIFLSAFLKKRGNLNRATFGQANKDASLAWQALSSTEKQSYEEDAHLRTKMARDISNLSTNKKRYNCAKCGKEFNYFKNFKPHQDACGTSVDCSICGKSVSSIHNLKHHVKYVHEKLQPFKCTVCTRGFYMLKDLERHSLTHTGVKPFSCTECGFTCAVKSNLRRHQRTQHKIKN